MIKKKEFATITFDLKYKAFEIHIAALSVNLDDKMHPLMEVKIAHMKVDETLVKVLSKYVDFVDVFSLKLIAKLLKYTKINDYAIQLVNN